jgi:NADH-quinone oxidoreductase subunit A
MDPTGLQNYLPVLMILLLGVVFAASFILLSYLFGPKNPKANKLDVYECGAPVVGDARERFSVKFFLIAMIFLVFDVEVVFLFPWAILLKEFKESGHGVFFFVPMLIFLIVLGVGLVYEWRSGTLDWES